MNESTKPFSTTEEAVMKEQTKPTTRDSQRGISVTEVLITLATVATTLLVGGMGGPKLPVATGD